MTELSEANLKQTPLLGPRYDRSRVTPGIVHFGVGAFHRAHQAFYIDEVLAAGNLDWGIIGVGLLPSDQTVRDIATSQDCLYTLTTVAPDETEQTRVIGSILDVLYAPDDPEAVLEILTAETTRIVSLTVTEGGYAIDDATGEFAPTDPLTLADLAEGGAPRSVWAFLTEALRRRRAAGVPAFAVMSCDNIQGNGRVARETLIAFACHQDPELAAWLAGAVAFPSSMVDRITPVPTPAVAARLQERTGVLDRWALRSESFIQWVLEDHFPGGRPPLGDVAVQLTDDVEPYEHLKLRLLNASHQVMSQIGLLAGYEMVDEVCRNQLFESYLRRYMHTEAIPTLEESPGIDPFKYCDVLMERFSSRAVRDTLARQVVDSSDRIPKFLLPVLRHQLAADGPIDCCVMTLAAWATRLEQHLIDGAPKLSDRRAAELLDIAARERTEPGALLDYAPVFGGLGNDSRLRETWLRERHSIAEFGAKGALEELLAKREP